jgi:amino acid adenylation domain-containing protein
MLFTVLEDLENSTNAHGDNVVIVDDNTKLTFSQLHSKALSTAQALVGLGINPGDRVGVCMSKSADQVVSLLAILYANGIFVPILPTLKYKNIAYIIENSGMKTIITDEKRIGEIEHHREKVTIVTGIYNNKYEYPNLPYISQNLTEEKTPPFTRISTDIAAIIYSSGSTGMPKGIMISHRNLFDGARIVANYLGTNQQERIACILSFNFDYGLNQIWQSFYTGCSMHLHELILPNDCIRFLATQKITALPLMPALITRLFDARFYNSEHQHDLSSVRYVCSSGGRVSSDMQNNIKNNFPIAEFFPMYGLTEAFRSTYLHHDRLVRSTNAIGEAIPDVEIIILDENGNKCSTGIPGELVHRGGCISKGYWNDPEKTADRFRTHPNYPGEILVYSGDLVVEDEYGVIMYISRMDEMMKHNGIRISPTEIESVAEGQPDVSSVLVFGIENIDVGHDIVLVYTTQNADSLNESEFRLYLKKNLPSHMQPQYIVQQKIFPVTGNQGKINRQIVKEKALKTLGIFVK